MVKHNYTPPDTVLRVSLAELLAQTDRRIGAEQVPLVDKFVPDDLYCSGDLSLVEHPCVSVVGSRDVSDAGRARARRLARELVQGGVVVVSGLARGVDAEAMSACIKAGGRTIGVLGTGLNRATPVANGPLQEEVYSEHLLISQFAPDAKVHRSNFPRRNRTMAAISNATVIVEATDKSGTLHQAAETLRLGRWLFIMKSVVDNPSVTWPAGFINNPRTVVLTTTEDVLARVGAA